jgi:SAM-dependent methyltransferase
MTNKDDSKFEGSIPRLYDRYMVPLIFEPYADDIATRVVALAPKRVLELAAGTGVVTRHLAQRLPAGTTIVATDLNQPMLDEAARVGTSRPVEWRQADAMQLPFPDASFDAVVCQFGAMFFPDKAKAFAEARRVLRPGGHLLLNVWDRIEANDFVSTICGALDELFPDDPPRFMHRGPHGHSDKQVLATHLAAGGFERPEIVTVTKASRCASPGDAAIGYCQGSPLRMELEAKGPDALARGTDAAVAALTARFGAGPIEGAIQAHVVVARKE